MCLIILKEVGVAMPDEKLIRTAWEQNPDGAGVSWFSGRFAHFQKGFMHLKALEVFLKQKKFGLKDRVVLHFRIGTSGGKTPSNTHPFILSDNEIDLAKTEGRVLGLAFHNGICGRGEKTLSDTAVLVRDILSGLAPFLGSSLARRAVENLLESKGKFLIWSRGELYKFGAWEHKEGLWLSNLNHEGCKTRYADWDYLNYNGRRGGINWLSREFKPKEKESRQQKCCKCGTISSIVEPTCPKCDGYSFTFGDFSKDKKDTKEIVSEIDYWGGF